MKNYFFGEKKTLFGILEIQFLKIGHWNILKLLLAIFFGVRIFRVFEVLGKLLYSPTMFISATQFVTCHVNFMKNMKLTPSDVQEMSQ